MLALTRLEEVYGIMSTEEGYGGGVALAFR